MTQSQLDHKILSAPRLRVWLGVLLVAMMMLSTLMTAQSAAPVKIAVSGDLDPTFDGDGQAITDMGGGDKANAIARQTDGKLVVAGTSNNDFALARYNTDGSLDTSFNSSGKIITDFGNSDRGNAVAIQADGKIVVAGTSGVDFALARYNSDGSPDTTFGGDGMLTTNTDSLGGNFRAAEGTSVAIQTDGKIVVGGSIKKGDPRKFALVRFLTDGSLDLSLNGSGFVTAEFEPGGLADEEIKAIAVRFDGEIAAVGYYKSGQFALVRYNPDGSLDSDFGNGGRVSIDSKVTTGYGVAWQADGSIVVAGSKYVTDPTSNNCVDSSGHYCEYKDLWLARFNRDGSLDRYFGTKGEVTAPVNSRGNDDNGRTLMIQVDGKMIVAGYSDMAVHTFSNSGTQQGGSIANDFSMARFTAAGALDTSFGISGTVTTPFFQPCGINQCAAGDEAYAALLQDDGKIVAAGVIGTASSSTSDFALARYDNDVAGPPILRPDTNPLPDKATTAEETPVTIDVLANDSSLAGFALSLISVSNSNGGTATIVDGKIQFTPTLDFVGPAYFFYAVSNATPGIDRVQTSGLVNVTPVNDPPTAISLSRNSVAENLPEDTEVGRFMATDGDADDVHTFFLLPGQDSASFRLSGDRLLTQMPFDYESKSSYTILVKVTDSGNESYEQDLTVTVSDENDAPTAINLSNNRILENSPAGSVVGTLSSTDPDSGDTHTHALVPGAGSDSNALFTLNGNTLATAAVFDYERQTAHSVRVRSTDQRGAFLETGIVIAVDDQASPPDAPPNILSLCSGDPITLINNSDSNPAKQVLVEINNVVISNLESTTCTVTGVLSVKSNGSTINNLAFQGNVDARNQFSSSTIPNFDLDIAGINFALREVSVEYVYGSPQLRIRQPAITMPADWGGLSAPFGRASTLNSGGFESTGVAFNLPKIKTKGGYGLQLSGSLKPVGNGYEIAADGILTIPGIGKNKATGAKGQTCGINAGVTIYAGAAGETVMEIATHDPEQGPIARVVADNTALASFAPRAEDIPSVVRLSEVRLGFKCSQGIAIGSTGMFLTSVKGTVSLRPDTEFVKLEVTIEAGKRIPAINKPAIYVDGSMQVDISPAFKLDLDVALYVLSLEIAQAQATVTETSFRANIRIDAVFIHGEAWIHAWSTDDKFHFTGGGKLTVGLKKGSISDSCIPLPCGVDICKGWLGIPYPCGIKLCDVCIPIPPTDFNLASAGAQFGEFTNGRYGFKGWIEVPVFGSVGFYVDEEGDIDFGSNSQYQLVQGPAVRTAYARWRKGELSTSVGLPEAHNFVTDRSGKLVGVTIDMPLDKSVLVEDYDRLGAEAAAFIRSSNVISQVNLLKEADVSFILQSEKPLDFSLITPDGDTVTMANYASHPKYAITYLQSDRFEPANPQAFTPGTARLRFTHASSDASLSTVDVQVDDFVLFANVSLTGAAPLDYTALAPGEHTVRVLKAGSSQVLFTQQLSMTADVDYSLFTAGSSLGRTTSALSILTDDNSSPAGYEQARVRFVNAAGMALDMYVNGVKLFAQIPFKGASGYASVSAGTQSVEFRNSSGQVVGQTGLETFAPGVVYTFFAADILFDGQPTIGYLQRLDAEYVRSVRSEYGVDQAEMGAWQVQVDGDLENTHYIISLSGPTSPPVLGGVMVDATNLNDAQLGWMVTSDYASNECNIYLNPGPIFQSVTVTDTNGARTTEIVPVYEGFAVMQLVIDDPNDLGRPLNMGLDISNVPSGEYHMWMRVEDGVNPPVPAYAIDANSAQARTISSPDDLRFGVNAARVAKTGYDPLAQLADAVTINVDQSASWPATWDATIRTQLDETTGSLYIEWDGLAHPDAANYEVLVSATPNGSSQVISAGNLVSPKDAEGKSLGAAVGFIDLPNIEPDQTYAISIRAINGFNGSTVESQAVNFKATGGDYALTTPAASYTVAQGESINVSVSLKEIQALFYPEVSLGLDMAGTPRGLNANFTWDAGGTPLLGTANPTARLQVLAGNTLPVGTYDFKVIGYNGTQQRLLPVKIVVVAGTPTPEQKLYLPAVVR